ncbi:MAG TPA: T9SS type A sorting domain-containing protein [Candidatus Didemnitutus sp.]|nr:T9SS type A sorting domain-containing protein [Candidatus Didemnitutus sp.]
MKHFVVIAIALIGTYLQGMAQAPVFDLEWTTLGRVEMLQSNYGMCGFEPTEGSPGLFYPRTSGWQYLFASGLWLGGYVRGYDDLRARVIPTYVLTTGLGSAVPGELRNGRLVRPDLADQYQIHRRIENGVEVLSSRYHLGDTTRYQTTTKGFIRGLSDLDVREWTYTFDDENMTDVVVRRHEFINTGVDTIFGFIPSWVLDPDVGDRINPQQASLRDRHRVILLDQQTVFYTAFDNDESRTGEFGFVVLESPPDSYTQTVDDKLFDDDPQEHFSRYEKMSNGKYLSDLGPTDISAIYSMSAEGAFEPGDTLRYTSAFVMMSATDRQQRMASGGINSIRDFYADAATRIRSWMVDLPSSIDEVQPSRDEIKITPHPVADQWTIRATPGSSWEISIYNINGVLIHRTLSKHDGMAVGPALPTGMYHVVLRCGEKVISTTITSVR